MGEIVRLPSAHGRDPTGKPIGDFPLPVQAVVSAILRDGGRVSGSKVWGWIDYENFCEKTPFGKQIVQSDGVVGWGWGKAAKVRRARAIKSAISMGAIRAEGDDYVVAAFVPKVADRVAEVFSLDGVHCWRIRVFSEILERWPDFDFTRNVLEEFCESWCEVVKFSPHFGDGAASPMIWVNKVFKLMNRDRWRVRCEGVTISLLDFAMEWFCDQKSKPVAFRDTLDKILEGLMK